MKYSKHQALILCFITTILVLSPIFQNWVDSPKDSFPLSYYPMFSKERKTTYGMYYLTGYDKDENKYIIPYRFAGSGGFNQVRRQIAKAAKSCNAQEFVMKVAEKVADRDDHPYADLSRIELVKGYYHLENYFKKNDTLPVHERVIALCSIERR